MLTYTTDAARACNVSLNTIRNWCRDYGAYLSPGASAIGAARAFDGRDMDVLRYIARLRSEGMQRDAIIQRLGETTFAEIDDDQPSTQTGNLAQIAPTTAQEGLGQAPAMLVALQAMQAQIAALQQANRRRFDTVTVLGIGICIGLLFAVGMIVLAWLYGGR